MYMYVYVCVYTYVTLRQCHVEMLQSSLPQSPISTEYCQVTLVTKTNHDVELDHASSRPCRQLSRS